MKQLKFWLMGLLLISASLAHCQGQAGTKTIILMRHAEKIDEPGPDPALTVQGHQRAQALAILLKDEPVKAVYATPYKRTQDTGKPLAEQKGLQVQTYEAAVGLALLEKIKTGPGDQTVVILGHSNSIPTLVNALLGREEVKAISEEVYGQVFVVTISPEGKTSLLRLQL